MIISLEIYFIKYLLFCFVLFLIFRSRKRFNDILFEGKQRSRD